jgi:hypothetical protein
MKMRASIDIEFEANSTRALEAALVRGLEALQEAVQYGTGAEPSSIRSNSTRVTVTRQQIEQVRTA